MPSDTPPFDLARAHRYFAADCFNRTWGYIDKPERSADEEEQMLLLAMASLWHWTQRADRTDGNLSVGHWQVSRVYSLIRDAGSAMRHAQRSLAFAEGSPPFFVAYAHEAIAQAAMVAGDRAMMLDHLKQARELAARVTDADERKLLEADLEALAGGG